MSNEMIALLMFSSMMLMLLTGQRVFGAIGIVASIAALTLWGGAGVLHDGRSGPAPTGEVTGNRFVLAPGTRMVNADGLFPMEGNVVHPTVDDLPPYLAPPRVNAGPDRAITTHETTLAGSVENAKIRRANTYRSRFVSGSGWKVSPRVSSTSVITHSHSEFVVPMRP